MANWGGESTKMLQSGLVLCMSANKPFVLIKLCTNLALVLVSLEPGSPLLRARPKKNEGGGEPGRS